MIDKGEIWVRDMAQKSERMYAKVEARVTQQRERGYNWDERITLDVDLYLDKETGIVVWDVERYEEWLARP